VRDLPSPSLRCTADYSMSTTDPDATFMHHKDCGPRLGYQTHYLVDGGKARIILNALVTPGRRWRMNRSSICSGARSFVGNCIPTGHG
jgi:hypothetical protein